MAKQTNNRSQGRPTNNPNPSPKPKSNSMPRYQAPPQPPKKND